MERYQNKRLLLDCNEALMVSTPHFEYKDLFQRLVTIKQEKEQRCNRRLFHSFDLSTKITVSNIRPKENSKIKYFRHGSVKYCNEPSTIVRNNIKCSKRPRQQINQSAKKSFLHAASVFSSIKQFPS